MSCADPKTGKVRIEAEIYKRRKTTSSGSIDFSVAPASGGEPVCSTALERQWAPGVNRISAEMRLADPHPWQLNDPYLYRMTARLSAAGSKIGQRTRDALRFPRFSLRERLFPAERPPRLLAQCPYRRRRPRQPAGASDPDLLRRDLMDLKAMGFNGVRFISIMPQRYQLDLCDEIGLMVYEESHASWMCKTRPSLPSAWTVR